MAAGAPTSCWARCTSCCSARTSHSSWNAKWPASFGSRHSKGRTATWLLPNQNNVYCFDEHTDRIPLFHAEVRESVQRHDGGDIDRTVDAHLDLAHKRTFFDFRAFSDNVVSCSLFHAALQRRNEEMLSTGIGTANH